MALVELGVWAHGAVDDALVVSKHDALAVNWDTKAAKSDAQIQDLFCTRAASDVF